MCEDPIQAARMVSSTHESQDLVVPSPSPSPSPGPGNVSPSHSLTGTTDGEAGSGSGAPGGPSSPGPRDGGASPVTGTRGPVNAITVLTLLDKLVNMLDTVQENQHKMESRQAEMEGAVRGIQADMTKLSKSHSHTANTVSKLLDKSRKVSVTMKEVRDKMERQAGQVKKLEANHNHLLKRNNFKVLIFQDENEIPSSVFVQEPAPFPRDDEEAQEGQDPEAPDGNRALEDSLHPVDLSSDEDVGLEGDVDEDGLEGLECDLTGERLEKTTAEKIKRSSLKKVDTLKKAFSRQNIEKKMTKIGTKIVSQEQRDKIKKSLNPTGRSPSFKVSPLTFSLRKSKRGSDAQAPTEPEASTQGEGLPTTEAHIELSPLGSVDGDAAFSGVHSKLAPELEEAKATANALEKEGKVPASSVSNGLPESEELPESDIPEADLTEGVSVEYALSATLPQDASQSTSPFDEEEEEENVGEKEEKNEEEREQSPVEEKAQPEGVAS
ncbi:caveolae-associated protein 2-like [Aplochiton taeniatus]